MGPGGDLTCLHVLAPSTDANRKDSEVEFTQIVWPPTTVVPRVHLATSTETIAPVTEVVGPIAGDDTILVITPDNPTAESVQEKLLALLENS